MGGNFGFWLVFFAEPIESFVRYDDSGFFRINGREREVLTLSVVYSEREAFLLTAGFPR
jgi:hypothetical protein